MYALQVLTVLKQNTLYLFYEHRPHYAWRAGRPLFA